MCHWSNTKEDSDKSTQYRPYYRPRSADVEITAYALLTLSLNKDTKNGLPVVRWLSVQRNSLGGYASTQVNRNILRLIDSNIMGSLWYIKDRGRLGTRGGTGEGRPFSSSFPHSLSLFRLVDSNIMGTLCYD